MSFKVFSKIRRDNKAFSIDYFFTSYGTLESCIVICRGDIAPFKGVRNSCEKDERTYVLYSFASFYSY